MGRVFCFEIFHKKMLQSLDAVECSGRHQHDNTMTTAATSLLPKGTMKTVNGTPVILTGEHKYGKSGKLFYAVQIVTYPFKTIGKSSPRYGAPQWCRAELFDA